MTREEKLEAIWSATHADFKGIAGQANPDAWPPQHHGKRTILVNAGPKGTVLKLLEDLSNDEIDSRMPAVRAPHGRRGGAAMRTHRTQPPPAAKHSWEAHSTYTAELGVPDRRQYRRTPPGSPTVAISFGPATRSRPPTARAVS